jgi:N,N-dimethylformamidase
VLTGHHPEYWTWPMMQALRDYLDKGGRVMYLGGNGLYWVVSVDPERPHLIEIRRGLRGTALWRSAVGEHHHQTTGEQGGLWRDRGWAPQAVVGAGMAAQGVGPGRPYHRQPGSHEARAAFIFDGVGADEVIGDFGFALGGAGGIEVDRFDQRLGTPAHALLLATTTGFNDQYQHVVEEVEQSDSKQSGSVSPFVRGDLVFFETLGGGAVFSASSMTWCAALAWNDYDNNVSRITGNVLRRFRDPAPFRGPASFADAETRPAQAQEDHA